MLKSPALPTLCLLTLGFVAGLPLAGCKKQGPEQIDFRMGELVTAAPDGANGAMFPASHPNAFDRQARSP